MSLLTLTPPASYITDPERLAALAASGLHTEDVEPALERWTRLGSTLLGAPISLLSLVGADHQFFKSRHGLPEVHETPLSHSFCKHVVATRAPLVVDDARTHPLVHDNPAVTELGVLAYAGHPVIDGDGHVLGAFCVIDHEPRAWSADDLALLEDLAAGLTAEIHLRASLRSALALQRELATQARVDALTGLTNRRQLNDDLERAAAGAGPRVLAMYDLDGFKAYNDTFGHPAGDALLARVGARLADVATRRGGTAYRLGGDEFCVLVPAEADVEAAAEALREHGDGFTIGSSYGVVALDGAGLRAEEAMLLVDQRLYARKHGRSGAAREQAQRVLLSVLRAREPELGEHVEGVAALARMAGEALGLATEALDELTLVAQMHDIGKVAIPDSILSKPGPLTAEEWHLMREHTVIGERILSAAPALRDVASIVRSSHERWDGQGYPDALAGAAIPLGARIVLACDAFHAMTSGRPYAPARTAAEALAELRAHAGTQFDPRVVAVLEVVAS